MIKDIEVELNKRLKPLTYAEYRIKQATYLRDKIKSDQHYPERSDEQIMLIEFLSYFSICNPKTNDDIVIKIHKKFYDKLKEGIYWKGEWIKDTMYSVETYNNMIELVDEFIKNNEVKKS